MPITKVTSRSSSSSKSKKVSEAPSDTAFERVRPLLGPSWVVEGEDLEAYERLLVKVAIAIGARDVVDWLLISDVVALTWEIQRSRRLSASLMRLNRRRAFESILRQLLSKPEPYLPIPPEQELASKYFDGDKAAVAQVDALFKNAGILLSDTAELTLSQNSEEFDRIDARTQRCEDRRDKILQQIEKRKAGSAERVLGKSEEIIDAEFETSMPMDFDER